MIEALLEAVPWDKVGEAVVAIGVGIAALVGIEISTRLLTGKGLLEHLLSAFEGLELRLKNWLEEKRVNRVTIERLVFVLEKVNGGVNNINKAVNVKIFGKTAGGRKYNTGEVLTLSTKTPEDAEKLLGKKEMEVALAEVPNLDLLSSLQ